MPEQRGERRGPADAPDGHGPAAGAQGVDSLFEEEGDLHADELLAGGEAIQFVSADGGERSLLAPSGAWRVCGSCDGGGTKPVSPLAVPWTRRAGRGPQRLVLGALDCPWARGTEPARG